MTADDRPSISELQRETPRWPSDWRPALDDEGEWIGRWLCTNANGEDDIVSADADEGYANDFARIVAMTRNAAPLLLEIVAAALIVEAQNGFRDSKAVYALRAALAKVRP